MSSSYLYRGPQSPQNDAFSSANNPLSPQRNPNRLSGGMVNSSAEVRGNLTRRFTTNALPMLSPIGQQRLQAAGDNAMSFGYTRVAPSERKIRHIENLLEQQRRINAELDQVDDETRREIEEGLRHERDATQLIAQSEPTTPPEYQDSFAHVPRPNRYSATSLTSPSLLANRPHRSSIHLTSPGGGFGRPYTAHTTSGFPSQSVPGSRRHSDDEDEDNYTLSYDTSVHRAAANPNRNSMPVTSYDRKRSAADLSAALGPLNTTSFLLEDDEKPAARASQAAGIPSSPDARTILQVQHTADGFPKLIRREENGDSSLSGSSAALDLALSQANSLNQADRGPGRRHRISLPPSALSSNGNIAPLNSILATTNDNQSLQNNRRSLEVKFSEAKRPSIMATASRNGVQNGAAKSLASYSTNDIPTLNTINGEAHTTTAPVGSPPSKPTAQTEAAATEKQTTPAQNSFGSLQSRQGQDFTGGMSNDASDILHSSQSGLQANAMPFGPVQEPSVPNVSASNMNFTVPAYYNGGFGMQMIGNGFNNMNLNGVHPTGMPVNGIIAHGVAQNGLTAGTQAMYPYQTPPFQPGGFPGYQQFQRQPVPVNRFPRAAVSTNPSRPDGDDAYNMIGVYELRGKIYGLCKDQHGCRFLQKKLDERREQDFQLIFVEVQDHFTELMTDPFGNYLCQRLVEHANDDQRTILIRNAGPSMVNIAVNQHGTRALQRLIENTTTPEQVQLLIQALGNDVVALIQDLNGNHVIQKCLTHLTSEDAEFIFSAVGTNCVVVGTHRHGCCVLQRCVDHASGQQKGRLVDCIITNAAPLVQDPFGNYVVQYVLDLAEPCFTQPLCLALAGQVAHFSKQKFSSNVIEKCIRCADEDTKRVLIHELMSSPIEMEGLLRDSFANYVVQTAIDFCPDDVKPELVGAIRPILPAIRNTPHGRRIASKITDHDFPENTNWIAGAQKMPPMQTPISPESVPSGRGNRMGMVGAPPQWGHGMDAAHVMNGNGQVFGDGHNFPQQNGFQGPHFNTNGNHGLASGPPFGHL